MGRFINWFFGNYIINEKEEFKEQIKYLYRYLNDSNCEKWVEPYPIAPPYPFIDDHYLKYKDFVFRYNPYISVYLVDNNFKKENYIGYYPLIIYDGSIFEDGIWITDIKNMINEFGIKDKLEKERLIEEKKKRRRELIETEQKNRKRDILDNYRKN